jgi:hypothetical protein
MGHHSILRLVGLAWDRGQKVLTCGRSKTIQITNPPRSVRGLDFFEGDIQCDSLALD